MLEARNHTQLILASASPRRKYLLEQAGLRFSVIPSTVDESVADTQAPEEDYVRLLAEAKADDIARGQPEAWVIGADTVVAIDGQVLGKPTGAQEARSMLHRLSGQRHRVHTGFAIVCGNRSRRISATVTTEVEFKTLSSEEIEWYLKTGEPFDKAGAYAIQGIGTFLVRRINGSYTNVVGLPVCEVIEALIAEGVLRY
ncbi:MAG: Maf family protein [Desulfobacteraceae bacterium]|nr:Maf family protein [Desulfobacteraceae bacterium]